MCGADQVERLTKRVTELFDERVATLHDPQDVAAGRLTVRDRQGNERHYPLVSVSIGVAMTGRRRYLDAREIVAVAAEMKQVAKQTVGSAVAIDRRGGDDAVHPPAAVERTI